MVLHCTVTGDDTDALAAGRMKTMIPPLQLFVVGGMVNVDTADFTSGQPAKEATTYHEDAVRARARHRAPLERHRRGNARAARGRDERRRAGIRRAAAVVDRGEEEVRRRRGAVRPRGLDPPLHLAAGDVAEVLRIGR